MSDNKESVSGTTALAGCIAAIALLIYGPVVWGFVLMKFWGWFLLPVFVGLPVLTLMQSIGVWEFFTLTQWATGNFWSQKDNSSSLNARIGMVVCAPWVVLFMGWAISRFIY